MPPVVLINPFEVPEGQDEMFLAEGCRHYHHSMRVQHGYDWQARSDLAETYAPWSHRHCRASGTQSSARACRQYGSKRTTPSHASGTGSVARPDGTGRGNPTALDATR